MPTKLFLFGRPGCGKSSATRHIVKHVQNKKWSIKRFKDFDILKVMSTEDQYKQAFELTLHDGFDVIDEHVFDVALKELESQLSNYIPKAGANEIIIIEFARGNYAEAFQHFSHSVLEDAYILFIDANLDECIKRVKHRMIKPKSSDDHYVSEDAIRKFYREQILPKDGEFQVKLEKIDNNGSLQKFIKKVDNFVDNIFK